MPSSGQRLPSAPTGQGHTATGRAEREGIARPRIRSIGDWLASTRKQENRQAPKADPEQRTTIAIGATHSPTRTPASAIGTREKGTDKEYEQDGHTNEQQRRQGCTEQIRGESTAEGNPTTPLELRSPGDSPQPGCRVPRDQEGDQGPVD